MRFLHGFPGRPVRIVTASLILLTVAAAGARSLAVARRVASGVPLPGRRVPAAALDAAAFPEGRPTLLLGVDPSCGACTRAQADLQVLRLEVAGIGTAVIGRDHPAAAPLGLARGPYPIYVLVEVDGRVRATRRGYTPPSVLLRWIQDRLVAPS